MDTLYMKTLNNTEVIGAILSLKHSSNRGTNRQAKRNS